MRKLFKNKKLRINTDGIKITDWIQSIAALTAIIAAIIGFAKLFMTDINQQKQIDNLTTLAQQAQIQNELLLNQISELKLANELKTMENNIRLKAIEKDLDIRIQDIKPSFAIEGISSFHEALAEYNELKEKNKLEDWPLVHPSQFLSNFHRFINHGDRARNLTLITLKGNQCKVENTDGNREIERNEKLKLKLVRSGKWNEDSVNLKLTFSDKAGNKYDQFITGDWYHIRITDPIEQDKKEEKADNKK